jgi:hypothetical protein
VLEREVDYAIRLRRGIPQAVEIIQGAAMHLGPSRNEGVSRGI